MSWSLDTPYDQLEARARELVAKRVFDGLAITSPRAFALIRDRRSSKFELLWAIQQAEMYFPNYWRELDSLELEAAEVLVSDELVMLPTDIQSGIKRYYCLSFLSLKYVMSVAKRLLRTCETRQLQSAC